MEPKTVLLRRQSVCPHCQKYLALKHIPDTEELVFICEFGCKAEYEVLLKPGRVTEGPICGAGRP